MGFRNGKEMGRSGQALTSALGSTTPYPIFLNSWSQLSVQTGTKPRAQPAPQHLQPSPCTHSGLRISSKASFNLLSPINIKGVYIFFHPNFTSFSPEKAQSEDVTPCPTLSPEPAERSVPGSGLLYACSDEAAQKRAWETFNFPSFR